MMDFHPITTIPNRKIEFLKLSGIIVESCGISYQVFVTSTDILSSSPTCVYVCKAKNTHWNPPPVIILYTTEYIYVQWNIM